MKLATVSLAIVAFGVAPVVLTAQAAQVRYRLTPIEVPFVQAADPQEMNDKGEVVGTDGHGDAFLWNGQYVNLGTILDPASPVSRARGINDRSDIVGMYIDAQGVTQHFLLTGKGRVIFPQVPGDRILSLHDVNNRRQVIGTKFEGEFMSFIWHRGETEFLAPFGEAALFRSVTAINDRGAVVGTVETEDGARAVLSQEGETVAIGPLGTQADDISNRGKVIVNPVDQPGVGLVWEDGVLSPLPLLPGSDGTTRGFDINNRNVVVGLTGLPNGTTVATLWKDNGTVINLNTRVALDDPLQPFVRLAFARLINDRGQIVVFGVDSRDGLFRLYLLDPVRR